jgi:hypothetical protein
MRVLSAVLLVAAIAACHGPDRELDSPDAVAISTAVPSARHDTSPPLTEMVAHAAIIHPHDDDEQETELSPLRREAAVADPVVQRALAAAAVAPATIVNIEGLGAGMVGGGYAYPPDTASAVGTTQVMETVNDSIAVWDKTGHLLYGPKPTNTLFAGFGGSCETSNDGDAKIRWDALANRFVIVQFAYWNPPYGLCVAVSATADATGAWHRYFFQFNSQTDYPTLGIWPDAYYISINGVLTADNLDVPVCAFDRAKMLTGAQATRQCFSTAARAGVPIPSDLTGTTLPPAGAPNLAVCADRATGNSLNMWKVHVDWTTPANSTISAPIVVPVAAFTSPQVGISQPGSTLKLSPGGNSYPTAYRNFGDHEAYLVTDVVASGSNAGVRWYELRNTGGNPVLYQQGTFAPADGLSRFMPSSSIDKVGNIALGYSVSSTTVYPGIRFTGRLAADPLGQMTQGEGTIIAGGGASSVERWGDYSAMSVDPVDDCTFWYSQEYIASTDGGAWRTRLASFRMPGCASDPPPPPGGIVNGDFETGALAPWTSAGTTSITTTAHAGASAALAGKVGVTVKGDSSVAQTFTAPATGGTLSFWYKVVCNDSLQYDWATATLKDNTAATTTTPLAKTCNKTGTWVKVSAALVASHSYTLTLLNHDDGYSNTYATYTIFDDVAIGGTTPPPPPPAGIVNGDFETGALTPWTSAGTTAITTTAHAGTSAALAGKVGVTVKGDSSIAQTFTASSTGGTLSFWYKVVCNDSLTYDWATATLKDNTTGATTTPLAKTCNKTGTWVQVSAALVANHAYTLTLVSHDDGYSNADATYTIFDDVAVK